MGNLAPDPFAFDPFAFVSCDPAFEQLALPDVPAAWVRGVAQMQAMSAPEGASAERWQQIVADATLFLDRWASTAAACGWKTGNLFGIDDSTHSQAFGLIIAMRGRRLAALDADRAYLIDDTPTTIGRSYRARDLVADDTQPVWQRGAKRRGR